MDEYKLKNYLNHLDREALMHLIIYLVKDTEEAKTTITMMSNEWDRMYPKLN